MKEKLKDYLQREFNFKETMLVLQTPINIYWCWGVEKLIGIDEVGLILKVNGYLWKHYVLISLHWSDTYIVTLLDAEFNPTKSVEGIYFDMLQDTVDRMIETAE